jgi:hypothetical protein
MQFRCSGCEALVAEMAARRPADANGGSDSDKRPKDVLVFNLNAEFQQLSAKLLGVFEKDRPNT